MKFELDQNGFITKYFYSGIKEIEFIDHGRDTNQLRYEKYLRSKVAKHEVIKPQSDIKLGELSALGMPWNYYYSYGNVFLEQSDFYTDLKKVELYAATNLFVEEDMEVTAWLWSYSAIDLWVNEELAGTIEKPVYKPINREEVKLKLKKGRNPIFVRLETLGVRDTKISFAIQIKERAHDIFVMLPDEETVMNYVKAEAVLNSAILKKDTITFSDKLPAGSFICYDTENPDFRKILEKYRVENVSGLLEIPLKNYASFYINIHMDTTTLKRHFERMELRSSNYLTSEEQNDPNMIYKKIAEVSSLTRSRTDGFALYPILARYYLGIKKESDKKEIMVTLSQIERRMDCSDFMTCGLVRLMKNYELSQDIMQEIKRVMLNFRYWMDETGQDGMCFWSENHSLMFYETAYFFGQEYAEDVFVRSGKTGKEMYELAKSRLLDWLNDVCEQGFDEFNSGVYSPITFAALLNLVDYGEKELSDLATKAADLLLLQIARHCFQSVIIAPQGRIYRDVLYPQLQAFQSIVNFIVPEAPYVYSEWLSALATSKYQIPKEFIMLMNQKGQFTYSSSNTIVDIYKTEDYILTSVQSSRRDGKVRVWEAGLIEENRNKFLYTKSLNECFHGTTQFEPGIFGYQQHLWYAALDRELVVFINHPGETCEASKGRPGYWHGNGIIPALYQDKNILGMIYVIPDTHPTCFTHLFWNTKKFDEVTKIGNWLFGRKGNGYIGIWCSTTMDDYNDVIFECEKRAYENQVAYLCICGSKKEDGEYMEFVEKCRNREVQFTKENNTLICKEFHLTYKEHRNETQYVD